jgi:alcohol dehydrogenase (cytochrome c)
MMSRALLLLVLCAGSVSAQVSFDRILRANEEPANWLTYSGTVLSQRHSQLSQITPKNVGDLELQWAFQAQSLENFVATPLVVDGVLYTVQSPNDIVALDAVTGSVFWTYRHQLSAEARPCCGLVNRGVAILRDTLFMATLDGHLIAVDARSGRQIWRVAVEGAQPEAGYAYTLAPLVVKNNVIVGTAGGEFGIRGFISAFNAETGKEAWRFYTIPGPGEPGNETWEGNSWRHGGASVWVTGSYDPNLNLTYWGIGNPGPIWNGDDRKGDNLYSNSVVALDADTGRLKWHFQFSPHDEFDHDAAQVPVLADMEWAGRRRSLMLWANRNGFFYVLDRATGEFLLGRPFVKVNWASSLDTNGRPIRVRGMTPSKEGTLIFPGSRGGTSWYSPSFSPRTGLFYIPAWMNYSTALSKEPATYVKGEWFVGGGMRDPGLPVRDGMVNFAKPEEGFGSILALDPSTGDIKWQFDMKDFIEAGVLTTASDVLFSGGRDGYFFALDARNGALLWQFKVGGTIRSGPMTYMADGRQYVAVAAGNVLFSYALPK